MNDKNLMTPEERAMAEMLEEAAREMNVSPSFKTELEKKLMNAHQPKSGLGLFSFKKIVSTAGWAIGWALLILMFIWVARTLAPQPQPAAGNTPAPTPNETLLAPKPASETYDRFGQTIYLQADLPATPTEAAVYNYQPEHFASLEDAHALAAQFGMNGMVYETGGETPVTKDFLIVDGNRWLHVRSDQYFQYYPDYPRYVAAINGGTPPANAEALIDEFLKSYGFDFAYEVLPSEIYGGYLAAPLTPDGRILCYEYFKCAGLQFQLDEQGILYVDGSLPKYELLGQYGIISAEEAFQLFIDPTLMSDPNTMTGMMEGMHSFSAPIQTWLRPRPSDQTLTIFGWLGSIPSLEGGAPLVTFDGYTVTGNTADIPAALDNNTFVEVTGQFRDQNGTRVFELESWKTCDNCEDGLLGVISRQGNQTLLTTIDNEILVLPDLPADLPFPLDNAFVIGARVGETYEWKSIDLRNVQGGGGGGGGLGFYKLNLSGTPVSFPTPTPTPSLGGGDYTVQEGDTLISIAQAHGITVEELMLANGLNDPTIFVGQGLVIPNPNGNPNQPSVGWEYKGQRGILTVSIYNKPDGSKRSEYYLAINNHDGLYPYVMLEGDELEQLQTYHNRPIEIWGKVVRYNEQYDLPVVEVERFNVPFPDLQFQIVKGRQELMNIDGQSVTAFTIENGASYVQLMPGGHPDSSIIGIQGDLIQQEILIIPDETFGGRPAMRIYAGSIIEEGSPELTITANQPYTYDDSANIPPVDYVQPTATIEKVELVYYMPDPRYITTELVIDQRYLQPAWLFRGQYSDGSEFFILIQALKDEFLLPELAPYTQPG